jgi:uncharacterized protein YkwD
MQDNLTTRRIEALPEESGAGTRSAGATSRKIKTAFWHMVGAVALAITMMAQPAASATPVTTPASTTGTYAASVELTSSALPATGAPTQSEFFAPTGRTVEGDFLGTYQKFGLNRIGYPVSAEMQENGLTVQYFERVRMERHPELAAQGYGILFTRLGNLMTQGSQFATVAPFVSTPARTYFPATGHSVAQPFLSYWQNNGGIQLFGYPISEVVTQDGLTVQWFERARMEYHPELASTGQAVQLTLLGSIAYQKDSNNTAGPQAQPVSAQAQAPAAPAQTGLSDKESFLLKSVNGQRAAAGLGAVQLSSALTDLARSRSNDMATRNYFSHTTPEGTNFLGMLGTRSIPYKFAGEILARNNYPDAQAAQTALTSYLNSAPHKAIIMDGRYTLVGVGYAKSASDSMHYFTVIFVQQ